MPTFVDFKAVKAAVTMLQVLEHYGIAESFKRTGNSLRILRSADSGSAHPAHRHAGRPHCGDV